MRLTEQEEFSMVMFAILSNQAESWAYMLKGKVHQEFKYRMEHYMASARSLRKFLEEKKVVEIADELGQPFSDLMLMIKNAESIEKRCEIMQLIKDITTGEIKIVDESNHVQLAQGAGG